MEKIVKTTISNNVVTMFKKILSIFLIVAIVINVVIPKSQELKENFMLAINCVTEMAQTNFYDKYAESVVSVTNGIAGNILNALNKAGLCEQKISNEKEQTATNKKQNKKAEPINTSTESGIIIENNVNGENTINILKAKTTGQAYTQNINEQTQYYNEGLINGNSKANNIGILFFILFSILVVRIKDTIAVLYNNKNTGKEPTWSK